jgi:hypothetical protein
VNGIRSTGLAASQDAWISVGIAAQKATDLRRLLADVEAKEKALRLRQDELEAQVVAARSTNWCEAAEKARYLLNLFAGSLAAQRPRRQKLIVAVLDDFRAARERIGNAAVSAARARPASVCLWSDWH